MGDKQTIGARVPEDLYQDVERYADERGIDRSTAIVELLRQGLGDAPDRSERPLEARIDALEDDVERIESDVCSQLDERVAALEDRSPWWWF